MTFGIRQTNNMAAVISIFFASLTLVAMRNSTLKLEMTALCADSFLFIYPPESEYLSSFDNLPILSNAGTSQAY